MTEEDTTSNNEEEDQEEITQEEAEAQFAGGYKKTANSEEGEVSSEADAEAEKAAEAEQKAAEEAEAEAEAKQQEKIEAEKAETEKLLKELPDKLRAQDGNIGGIKSMIADLKKQMEEVVKTRTEKTGDQPSEEELQEALGDPESLDALVEEYPDMKPMVDTLKSLAKGLQDVRQAKKKIEDDTETKQTDTVVTPQISTEEIVAQAEERALLRFKHPDCVQISQTDDFKDWILENGPSSNDYKTMQQLDSSGNPEDMAKADKMVSQWAQDFPDWWADRGAKVFSPKAEEAIKLYDAYKAHQESLKKKATKSQENKKRLEKSVVEEGAGGSVQHGVTDEDAFNRGYKKAKSHG